MKISIVENDSFAISITPETIAEAAMLVRLGMNSNSNIKITTNAYSGGTFQTIIQAGKKKGSDCVVPKRSSK